MGIVKQGNVNINGTILEAKQIKEIKFYIQITKFSIWRDLMNTNKETLECALSKIRSHKENFQSAILSFMKQQYLLEHPFDELELLNDKLSNSEYVAEYIFPGHLDSFHQILEVVIDSQNMIALNKDNYIRYKCDTLNTDDKQQQYLTAGKQTVIDKYNIDVKALSEYQNDKHTKRVKAREIERLLNTIEAKEQKRLG